MTDEIQGKKSPSSIDVHVGAQMRALRSARGLSQEKLGEGLGITFQQIQKYEKGSNRISASKLWEIGILLGVPVERFFEGLSATGAPASFVPSTEAVKIGKLLDGIEDPRVRTIAVESVRNIASISKAQQDAPETVQ